MMRFRPGLCVFLLTNVFLCAVATGTAQAPASGAIEFVASVRPTSGRPEPVREMTFYLLRKSLTEIRKETEQIEPPTDIEGFIDGLGVSTELKEWMKKHHTVQLAGTDFTKLLTAGDITDIPEFFDAYTKHNGAGFAGFPAPKYKESDREKNPQKYQRAREEYAQVLRRYVAANPDAVQGMDAQLADENPSQSWLRLQGEERQRIERRTLELAQTRYLAAKGDSNLNGRGLFAAIAPATYWITNLDTPALAGDARLRWDLAVRVRAGETTRIELSDLNALESPNRTAR